MKKSSVILGLIIIFALFTVSLASAQSRIGNVKGDVTGFDAGERKINIHTTKGEDVVVQAPEGFEFSSISVGTFLHVKGRLDEQGMILADWVKEVKDHPGNGEGGKTNSAYCSGRKDKPHPLAVGIEELYGLSSDEIMPYFCDGYGFGQIMLALQTQELKGEDIDMFGALLEQRSSGKGWGQIWKELKLVGQPGEASSPPGHLKRPAHAGPPEGKGSDN
jgi:hypothetical protein